MSVSRADQRKLMVKAFLVCWRGIDFLLFRGGCMMICVGIVELSLFLFVICRCFSNSMFHCIFVLFSAKVYAYILMNIWYNIYMRVCWNWGGLKDSCRMSWPFTQHCQPWDCFQGNQYLACGGRWATTWPLDLPPTQKEWQGKVYRDSLLKM